MKEGDNSMKKKEAWKRLYHLLEKCRYNRNVSFGDLCSHVGLGMESFILVNPVPVKFFCQYKTVLRDLVEDYDRYPLKELIRKYDKTPLYKGVSPSWNGVTVQSVEYTVIPLRVSDDVIEIHGKVRDVLLAFLAGTGEGELSILGRIFLSEEAFPEVALLEKLSDENFLKLVKFVEGTEKLPPWEYFETVVRLGVAVYTDRLDGMYHLDARKYGRPVRLPDGM